MVRVRVGVSFIHCEEDTRRMVENLHSKGARKPRIVGRLFRNGHTLWIIDQWRCGIPSDDVNFAMLNEGRAPGDVTPVLAETRR